MFTLTDKTLLDRVARMVKEQHQTMLARDCPAAGWGATEESRKAKLVFDRLVRDERDLRALGKRMCAHFDVKADRTPAVMEAASVVLGTADPIGNVLSTTQALATAGNPEFQQGPGAGTVTEPSLGEQRAMGVHPSGGDLGF